MTFRHSRWVVALFVLAVAFAGVGVSQAQKAGRAGKGGPDAAETRKDKMKKKCGKCPFKKLTDAVCVLAPTQGNTAKGIVRFSKVDGGIKVVADVEGLTPNAKHAIHIHEFGDCTSADGSSAGGHYNPKGHDHALPDVKKRHAGDLGNLTADAKGHAHYEITVKNIRIAGPKNPILGRAVVVHAKADDGSQPTGNAGARISCGVIGLAKSTNPPPAEPDDQTDSDDASEDLE